MVITRPTMKLIIRIRDIFLFFKRVVARDLPIDIKEMFMPKLNVVIPIIINRELIRNRIKLIKPKGINTFIRNTINIIG